MKTCQPGTGDIPEKKEISNVRGTLRNGLRNACEQLSQKQRKTIIGAMLFVFTILVGVSIADIFRNRAKLSETGHIPSLKITKPTKALNDTVSLKTIDHETE
jgi:hypothetical protein